MVDASETDRSGRPARGIGRSLFEILVGFVGILNA